MRNVKNICVLLTVVLLSACSVSQQKEFWFSEDGKYLYKNSAINTATYETFRPLQQYHGKQIKGIKQNGRLISFSLQDATNLSVRINRFAGASINGVALKSRKYDSLEEEVLKAKEKEEADKAALQEEPVPLKKKSGLFSKKPKTPKKDPFQKKPKKVEGYDLTQLHNKTIDWIVVFEHGIYIRFTDRTKFYINGNERCTPCINNVKYQFTECY
jgi:hypothetical protein